MFLKQKSVPKFWMVVPVAGFALLGARGQSTTPVLLPGNVVVAVEGCGVQGGTCTAVPNGTGTGTGNSSVGGYGDNQAAPLTLMQFAPNGTTSASYVNSVVLPQTTLNANVGVSGEYGSSSEATLQLSGGGQYLTIGAYGINAATFDANPAVYGAAPSLALAQTGSLTGQSAYSPVPRVVALIDPYGNVNTSSVLYNIFNLNNPRSVYTADGVNVYLSGQGSGTDATGGVFLAPLFSGVTAPVAITGLDTTTKTVSQDTRTVQIYNGTLYVSTDSKGGTGSTRSFVGSLGTPPATGLFNGGTGPTQLNFANNAATPVAVTSNGKLTLTASETNGINSAGQQVNLSASNYFFANAQTLYIADTGNSKQTSATSLLGDGGLQKWVNTAVDGSGQWQLQYTISAGLGLVVNSSGTGTSGLYGLTGVVSGASVSLYATNATLSDLDTTYLYGFTDVLASVTKPATGFTLLATAPADSNFKGVSMAPTLAPGSATIVTLPSGLALRTSGTGCAAGQYQSPVTLAFTPGSTCQLTVNGAQNGSVFESWNDGTKSTTDTVTASSGAAVYRAKFADSTTTTVTSVSPASVTIGAATTLTAAVSDNLNPATSPAGTVTFTSTVNGVSSAAGTATVTNGVATVSYNTTSAGANTVTASFTPGPAGGVAVSTDTTGQPLTVAKGALTMNGGLTFTGSTGGSAILSVIIGYPATTAPTGSLSVTVNGSSNGVGTPSCLLKAKHFNCSYPYTIALPTGSYQVNFTQAADSNYTAVTGMDTLKVQ